MSNQEELGCIAALMLVAVVVGLVTFPPSVIAILIAWALLGLYASKKR